MAERDSRGVSCTGEVEGWKSMSRLDFVAAAAPFPSCLCGLASQACPMRYAGRYHGPRVRRYAGWCQVPSARYKPARKSKKKYSVKCPLSSNRDVFVATRSASVRLVQACCRRTSGAPTRQLLILGKYLPLLEVVLTRCARTAFRRIVGVQLDAKQAAQQLTTFNARPHVIDAFRQKPRNLCLDSSNKHLTRTDTVRSSTSC